MAHLKLLADCGFAKILTESVGDIQTTSGQSLIKKYQQYLLTNECSYGLVNGFINEAKNCMFDNAVAGVMNSVCGFINKNKYTWQLASTCEQLEGTDLRYNYLNKNACKHVENLLEGKTEDEVVNYIKAGALKNVMFCEAFRNITKSIFQDVPLKEMKTEYTSITPISFYESVGDKTYFEVLGLIYSVGKNGINEENSQSVSPTFLTISRLLESKDVEYVDDAFRIKVGNSVFEAKECGKCKKIRYNEKGEKVEENEFTAAQLREHNDMYIGALGNSGRLAQGSQFVLEAFAKLVENLDNVTVLDNARIINSNKSNFVIIEHEGDIYAKSLNRADAWETRNNVVDALNFIKTKTNIDLNEHYQEQIQKVVESKTEEEQKKVLNDIKMEEIKARKERIEKLTEQYKNDSIKLAMLAKVAEDLNKLA